VAGSNFCNKTKREYNKSKHCVADLGPTRLY
jgi:hypothetical protein